jgi:uncharacterized protein YkwD
MVSARSLFVLGAAACALPAVAPAHAAASSPERSLVRAVNDYRRAHDLPPLRSARSLARTADRTARRIMRTDRIRHSRPINSRYRRAHENLAWHPGRARDAQRVVRMWEASDAHRAVLLSRNVRWIGAGREYGSLSGRRSTVWVLQVGGR